MKGAWFIAGTDTGVGKTYASCALLHALRDRGLEAVGMKPIAAGIDASGDNEDVRALIAASGVKAARELINPYLFAPPIAPHIAAAEAGVRIDCRRIGTAYTELAKTADIVLVEGVGGFRVPLDDATDTADLAVALGLPLILVVGLRLGCLNHALLTVEAIAARRLGLAGWIANGIDPAMARPEANIAALRARIAAPLLGVLPYGGDPEAAAGHVDLRPLFGA